MFSGGSSRGAQTSASSSALQAAAEQTVTLTALNPVSIQVSVKNPDGTRGEILLPNTPLARGDQRVIPWRSALYITATVWENLQVELNGVVAKTPLKGKRSRRAGSSESKSLGGSGPSRPHWRTTDRLPTEHFLTGGMAGPSSPDHRSRVRPPGGCRNILARGARTEFTTGLMEQISYLGKSLTRWQVGKSTFLAWPEKGARLMSWNHQLGDWFGARRDLLAGARLVGRLCPRAWRESHSLPFFGANL